jgi:hypothetical protein
VPERLSVMFGPGERLSTQSNLVMDDSLRLRFGRRRWAFDLGKSWTVGGGGLSCKRIDITSLF